MFYRDRNEYWHLEGAKCFVYIQLRVWGSVSFEEKPLWLLPPKIPMRYFQSPLKCTVGILQLSAISLQNYSITEGIRYDDVSEILMLFKDSGGQLIVSYHPV